MKGFYGSRFSAHMTKTPEGFLICHDVPICRTGSQEYLPRELGIVSNTPTIEVIRPPGEVFKDSAVSSFEGKPVTDDHPPVGVDPSNYAAYTKGAVQNVRRGSGADKDKLICDIVIYDAALIAKVESGKREISCGYDCKYINNGDGTFHQADIIGNHVAIVDNGRAGHDVAIKDSKPEGGTGMTKKHSIWHRMFASFVKDADPEDIQEAAKAVSDAENGGGHDDDTPPKNELQDVMDAIDALNERVNNLHIGVESGADDDDPDDDENGTGTEAMDDLEEELDPKDKKEPAADDDAGEENVTEPPEDIETDEDEPANEGKEDPEDRTAQDKAIALRIIRSIKPIVATMPNPQRRRVSDAMSRAVRKALRKQPSQPLAGGYGALSKRRKVHDHAANNQAALRAFGENCRKRNPHFKGGK